MISAGDFERHPIKQLITLKFEASALISCRYANILYSYVHTCFRGHVPRTPAQIYGGASFRENRIGY